MRTDRRRSGRAKNSLLAFFEQTLYIPKIYLDATWNHEKVDVLAIDRDGSGDVHTVVLYASDLPTNLERLEDCIDDVNYSLGLVLDKLFSLPAQYKYVAAVNTGVRGADPLPSVPRETIERSYAPDGIGRVGYFSIDTTDEDDPRIKLVMKPERFRARIAQLANDYIEHHTADWEIRA